jgi:PAS domain-containing protein
MSGSRLQQQLSPRTLGFIFCIAGATVGAIGFAGWLTNSKFLEAAIPGQPLMMPNTAASLLLIGMAAAARTRRPVTPILMLFAVVAALFVLMIGLGTITEYMFSFQTELDQLIIRTQEGPYPGRISLPTTAGLAFLSLAILTFDVRSKKWACPSEWFALSAGVIASTALLGQLFGAGPLYRFTGTPIIGVAIHTALGLLAISWGLLLGRPDAGVMSLIMSRGPGGVLLRRLAPLAVVAPVGFAILSIHLMRVQDQSQIELLFAALTIVSTLASLIFLAITAAHLNSAHETIERMQTEASELIDLASDGIFVADLSGRYIDVNRAACQRAGE